MRFTQKDIAVLVSMTIAIILMSIVFPAIGLADDSVESSEIPEFTVDTNTFEFAGELPQGPGTPSQGTLSWDHETGTQGNNERTLQTDNGNATLALTTIGSPAEPGFVFTAFDANGIQIANVQNTTTTEGTVFTPESSDGSWKLRITFTEITEVNTDVYDYTVRYEIVERPDSTSGWLSGIPIVGDLFGGGEALVSGLVWVGSVVWWGIATAIQVVLNVLATLALATVFMFQTLFWLFTTYTAIITGANGIVAVFMTVPVLLLGFEYVKILFLAISLLPTT